MKNLLSIFAILFLSSPAIIAQYNLPFGFEKRYDVLVYDSLGSPLENPWAGGMNACQFGAIDLDGDGISDLVVFDRNGNRTLTYRNTGIAGQSSYVFDAELATMLPRFDDWVIFADYNMDGRSDIFAYSKGFAGIKVYRNTGNIDRLFDLVVSPYLKSFQGNGYVNVLVTYADYPAINDIDNDGDLDLLTFWGLGSFVEFHQNESMERYGTADSLIFSKTKTCWGQFAESDESNIIYLDTCFEQKQTFETTAGTAARHYTRYKSDPKHTGSTFMIFDNNGDGLPDLLLGDVDYASPAMLTNGGTPDEAFMINHTFSFPQNNDSINLLSFPVMSFLDVNNDDIKDMIVAPFDPSLVKAQNLNNIWLYHNKGQTNQPDFELINKSFLQDEMLDFGAGAVPVFFDYNNDGLMDIVVGNFGYLDSSYHGPGMNLYCNYRAQLALLKNVGTATQPSFRLIHRNYANLPSWFPSGEKPFACVPAFADLDGDGDEDMLVGNDEGTLFYFKNTASTGQPANFQLIDKKFQNIDAGSYSAPQLFDLDGDGSKDLLVGKGNGTISWYQNLGTYSNPEFTLITDSLGKVDVRNPNLSYFGYCVPHFYKDNQGEIHLFAGSEFGQIHYYNNINNNLDGKFTLVMKNYLWIDEGLRSTIAIGNINSDNYPDMMVGNYAGGLACFMGTNPPPAEVSENQKHNWDMQVFPNPASNYITVNFPKSHDFKIEQARLINFLGKEIFSNFGNSNRFFVGDFPAGIYLLQVTIKTSTGNYSTGCKIIIQH